MPTVTMVDLQKAVLDNYRLKRHRAARVVEDCFRHLVAYFGPDCPADDIAARLEAYAADKLGTHSSGTVRLHLCMLRRGFNLLQRAGRVKTPPFPEVAAGEPRKGFWEPQDVEAICRALPEPISHLIRFLWLTGWRVGEAKTLLWRSVDFEAGVFHLEREHSKNGKGRTFPFTAFPELEALMKLRREQTDWVQARHGFVCPWVFWRESPRGNYRDRVRPIVDFQKAWKAAKAKCGLLSRLVHDFRRSAVRRLERANVPRSVAMQLTGHLTSTIYERYDIVDEDDLRNGVRQLAEYVERSRKKIQIIPKRTVDGPN